MRAEATPEIIVWALERNSKSDEPAFCMMRKNYSGRPSPKTIYTALSGRGSVMP